MGDFNGGSMYTYVSFPAIPENPAVGWVPFR